MKINCQFDFYEKNKKYKRAEMFKFKKRNVLHINYCNNECKKKKKWRWVQFVFGDNIYKFSDKNLTININWKGMWIENFKNSKGNCRCKKKSITKYKMEFHNLSSYNKIKKLLINKSKKKLTKKKLTKKIKK